LGVAPWAAEEITQLLLRNEFRNHAVIQAAAEK
ncbi:hypothetical protein V3C99_011051, partial [Haemonchus contortus]